MKLFTAFLSALLLPVLVPGSLAYAGSKPPAEKEEQTFMVKKNSRPVVINEIPGSQVIKDWRSPDNNTLIIETHGRGTYMATFTTPCHGIRFAENIGFSTMGPFELDRSTKVILPDGRRCYFKELVEIDDSKLKE